MTPLGNQESVHRVNGLGIGSDVPLQPFHATVDVLRDDHIFAARANIRDPGLLQELEAEIERDCEGLRSFLFAAQVSPFRHAADKAPSLF